MHPEAAALAVWLISNLLTVLVSRLLRLGLLSLRFSLGLSAIVGDDVPRSSLIT